MKLRVDIRCGRFSQSDFITDNWSIIFERRSFFKEFYCGYVERPVIYSFSHAIVEFSFQLEIMNYRQKHVEKSTCIFS